MLCLQEEGEALEMEPLAGGARGSQVGREGAMALTAALRLRMRGRRWSETEKIVEGKRTLQL
jgi:hypothetical protein